MKSPDSQQSPERKPGRSFTDPTQPLGDGVIERADPRGDAPMPGTYAKDYHVATTGHGVADRAKAVSVLRKAEELMATDNPSGETEAGRRRAIELACGRCGVKVDEYDKIIASDPELLALQSNVLASATRLPQPSPAEPGSS